MVGPPAPGPSHPDAFRQLFDRASRVAAVRARMRGLLGAIIGIAGELSLPVTLRRITESACALVDAEYGALGVIGPDQTLAELVHTGGATDIAAMVGQLPGGSGLIGVTLRDQQALRLADPSRQPEAGGFAPGHPRLKTFLGVPIQVRGRGFGYLYLGGKRGGREFDADDQDLVTALAASVGFAIENARLYEETKRRQAWLAASAEITTTLLAEEDPASALGVIVRRARQVTAARLAAIILPVDAGELTVAVAEVGDGLDAGALVGRRIQVERSRLAEAMSTGRAMFVADVTADGGLLGPVDDVLPLGGAMVVPLVAAGSATGALVICPRAVSAPLTQLDLEMAAAFAGHAALALQMSRVQRDRERLAVFEERDRIARDLHDVVIQRLFATGLQLTRAGRGTEPAVAGPLEAAVAELDRTIRDVRRTIFSLGSPTSHRGELRVEISEIVRQAEGSLGLRPTLLLEGPLEDGVPEEIHPHLLAALREALSNIARHARATFVEVVVRVGLADVLVEVRDDGCGPTGASRISGLANLRQRAQELGGRMDFGPGDCGIGTTMRWLVPLVAPVAPNQLSVPGPPRVPRP
jgi:signal transduction histidine kinase